MLSRYCLISWSSVEGTAGDAPASHLLHERPPPNRQPSVLRQPLAGPPAAPRRDTREPPAPIGAPEGAVVPAAGLTDDRAALRDVGGEVVGARTSRVPFDLDRRVVDQVVGGGHAREDPLRQPGHAVPADGGA